MNKLSLISPLFIALLLSSCGGGEQKPDLPTADQASEEVAKACTYAYTDAPAEVLWVAYKYTEKVGVKGVFEEATVTAGGAGPLVADALIGTSINIATASNNSGDPTRDPKIKSSFFGMLQGGETITGTITSAEGDEQSGTVTADITMNGNTQPVSGSYELTDDNIEMKFELSVASWSAMDALNELNKVCEDLHKGADGKSILWPDVTVFVSTKLAVDCN